MTLLERRAPYGLTVLALSLCILLLSGRAVLAKHHFDHESFGDLYRASRAVVDDSTDVLEPAIVPPPLLDLEPRDTGRFVGHLEIAGPPALLCFWRVSPPRGPPAFAA